MATVADRDRLIASDPSLNSLFISLTSEANISESIVALQVTNCPIQSLTVIVSSGFTTKCRRLSQRTSDDKTGGGAADCSSWKQVRNLFRTLGGRLPQLKSLSIHSGRFKEVDELPIEWLTEALQSLRLSSGKLERLCLHGLQLSYDTKIFLKQEKQSTQKNLYLEEFLDSLRNHPSLIILLMILQYRIAS